MTEITKEAISRAIFDPGATEGYKGERTLTEWQTDAVMRVLSTLPIAGEGKAPEGWQLVPVEPTEAMIEEANECEASWKSIWPAMLAAAPVPPLSTECAARRQGTTGGNDPADCNWPFCGCDPHADKVIAAIEESGMSALTCSPGKDGGQEVEAVSRTYLEIAFKAGANWHKWGQPIPAEQAIEAILAGPAPDQDGGQEVAIYHGNGLVDCGDAGHHNIELLKLIPAGTKLYTRPQPASTALVEAARDVVAERERQKAVEGWTPEHDDAHTDFSLAKAACIYGVGATLNGPDRAVMDEFGASGTPGWMKELWPWDIKWWKPKDRRRDLVKAAALIIAEIERLDRSALSSSQSTKGDADA